MNPDPASESGEHLTPHDLVTYFRCPYEMELHHAHRAGAGIGPRPAVTPADVVPLHRSPLFDPPTMHAQANEGRLDFRSGDQLIYLDEMETGIPVLFPSDRVHIDPAFRAHWPNLVDHELGFSGRPDLVVRGQDGSVYPIEYKSTHLFVGFHEAHGRAFDVLQAIAECRLVHATLGQRPRHGVVLYGDVAGDGEHEGWVEVPYGDAEERWLRVALRQIREDPVRAPVPADRNCANCEPNSEGLCRFAAARFAGPRPQPRLLPLLTPTRRW
ncbi:MAG TPA: hypothetical protein VLY85_01840 [Thermoplasmata archaeon]|nr:hypothetical protein [Thermoplasmata archaeon]